MTTYSFIYDLGSRGIPAFEQAAIEYLESQYTHLDERLITDASEEPVSRSRRIRQYTTQEGIFVECAIELRTRVHPYTGAITTKHAQFRIVTSGQELEKHYTESQHLEGVLNSLYTSITNNNR